VRSKNPRQWAACAGSPKMVIQVIAGPVPPTLCVAGISLRRWVPGSGLRAGVKPVRWCVPSRNCRIPTFQTAEVRS